MVGKTGEDVSRRDDLTGGKAQRPAAAVSSSEHDTIRYVVQNLQGMLQQQLAGGDHPHAKPLLGQTDAMLKAESDRYEQAADAFASAIKQTEKAAKAAIEAEDKLAFATEEAKKASGTADSKNMSL